MIKSGGSFIFKGSRCAIGAVILIMEKPYIATASHIFQKTGLRVQVESGEGIVRKFVDDFDIALIELPKNCVAEVTVFGSAKVLEEALLVNEYHSIGCTITRAGSSLLSLQFPYADMPLPGDSGSPIVQEGKVVGILSSVMLSNCIGTAVSSEVLRRLN